MTSLVLDCSVAIAWLIPEERSNDAVKILKQVTQHGAIVPSIWPLEIGNVLLTAQKRGRIDQDTSKQALYLLKELPITVDIDTTNHAWFKSFDLAQKYNLTLYDACYLELALRTNRSLITFDNALLKAASDAGLYNSSI